MPADRAQEGEASNGDCNIWSRVFLGRRSGVRQCPRSHGDQGRLRWPGPIRIPPTATSCRGDTGHAEVVRVTFDPDRVSYERLLDKFWECHDPTQVNRQGPDFGHQYRSVIFCETDRQAKAAEASKARLDGDGTYARPIATAIEAASTFHLAEEVPSKVLGEARYAPLPRLMPFEGGQAGDRSQQGCDSGSQECR